MDDVQEANVRGEPQQNEAFLIARVIGVVDDQGVVIPEGGRRLLGGDAMLLEIGRGLLGILFELDLAHAPVYICRVHTE